MSTGLMTTPATPDAAGQWSLDLDAELCDGGRPPSEERLAALVDLMTRTAGMRAATVQLRSGGRMVRLSATVDAHDLVGAADLTAALLHACARYAGLGRLVVVGVRHSIDGGSRPLRWVGAGG